MTKLMAALMEALTATLSATLAIALLSPLPAMAAQSLIPTPYPSAVPGAAPLDPDPAGEGGPQILLRDPYPQVTGEFSQGNPPIARRHRHQRLVPSTFKRKYRVERR